MLRAILYALLGVLAISFVRGFLGILAKGVGDAMRGADEPTATQPRQPSPKTGNFGGELVKDPVCGTFVSKKSPYSRTVDGTTHCFCSQDCLNKFAPSAS